MSAIRWVSTATLAALLLGCNAAPKTSDVDIAVIQYPQLLELMANPARGADKNLFKDLFAGKKTQATLILVDVRPPAKFAQGRLPGAVNIPLPELRANDARLGQATTLVVYASGWTDFLSPAGAKKLMALGYQNVREFRGGVENWVQEGGELEQ